MGPHALPGWDLGGFGLTGWLSGGCRISAAGSACHLCGGLPGGGTAEADASQGKSMDKNPGRPIGGRRAWLGRLGSRPAVPRGPGWASPRSRLAAPPSAAATSSPCCCRAREPLQLATARDKTEGKRDAKAQEEPEGKFSSPIACTEPALGLEGVRLKTRGAPASELPSQVPQMGNAHIHLGK